MADSLPFISRDILARVESGAFVPARRSPSGDKTAAGDRRNALSPLAITKKCIRYEPNVFYQRKEQILAIANTLNQPDQKILLLGGPQGSGKTSLIRGVIELMGSKDEQLLWFDVNRHTDFEEIIHFLIHYITYVCANTPSLDTSPRGMDRRSDAQRAGPDRRLPFGTGSDEGSEEPVQKLEKLIRQVSHMPLLLVLDNVEYIVNPEMRFSSFPFKEILNFLLGFDNIKMVLVGERLPYADMSPNQVGVVDYTLAGISEPAMMALMHSRRKALPENDPAILEQAAAPDAETTAIRHLYAKTQGYPWLLKILLHLNHQSSLSFTTINRLLESLMEPQTGAINTDGARLPIGELLRLLYERLPEQHCTVLQMLSFLRHPVNSPVLLGLVNICFPANGGAQSLNLQGLEDILEHPLLRPMLKVSYPPQEVLAHLRARKGNPESGKALMREPALSENPFDKAVPADKSKENASHEKFKPGFELYHLIKRMVVKTIRPKERLRIHNILQDFYMRERSQDPAHRLLRIKNRALLSEAKFHGSAGRNRRGESNGPTLNESGSVARTGLARETENAEPDWLDASANSGLSGFTNSRTLQLPELSDGAETSLSGPTFMEQVQRTNGKPVSVPIVTGTSPHMTSHNPLMSDDEWAVLNRSGAMPKSWELEQPRPQPEAESIVPPRDLHAMSNDVLSTQAQTDEIEKAIQQRLIEAAASHDQRRFRRELVELARYRAGRGHYQSATLCLQKAQNLDDLPDNDVKAEIYRLLGSISKETFHHNDALLNLNKAAIQIRKLMYEDETVNAVWLGRLGQVFKDLGEIQAYRKKPIEAREAFEQALRWFHSADSPAQEAETHFQLAVTLEDSQEPQQATIHYLKALEMDESSENWLSAAASLTNLGNLHAQSGNAKLAQDCYENALTYDQRGQNAEGQLNSLEALTVLFLTHAQLDEAEQTCKQALGLAMRGDFKVWESLFYSKLGQIYRQQKNWPAALRHFELALSAGAEELSESSAQRIHIFIQDAKLHA